MVALFPFQQFTFNLKYGASAVLPMGIKFWSTLIFVYPFVWWQYRNVERVYSIGVRSTLCVLYIWIAGATDIQYHILDWVSAINSTMCLSGVCLCVCMLHIGCADMYLFRTQACICAKCDLRLHFESLTDCFSKPVIYLFVYSIFPIDVGFLFRSSVSRLSFDMDLDMLYTQFGYWKK